MEFRQTIESDKLISLFNLPSALRNRRVEVVVSPADEAAPESPKRQLNLDFLGGPELPDSFFDPLPEEELQAWGIGSVVTER
ncbi:MAG: hypothetical protein LBI36_03710 [Oscillospiraceae bacterium]|jgi:hypothetical protein|nr:hypothetical protein [Oscillospiraceae bacterium]